jgi:hypothetical protein
MVTICKILLRYFYKTQKNVKGNNGKGKKISLQAWTGYEGSGRLRLPDFKPIDA